MKLLTAEELAVVLGVHPNTVLTGARSGLIPSLRMGPRVLRFDVDAVLKAMAAKPAAAASPDAPAAA